MKTVYLRDSMISTRHRLSLTMLDRMASSPLSSHVGTDLSQSSTRVIVRARPEQALEMLPKSSETKKVSCGVSKGKKSNFHDCSNLTCECSRAR